jgi:tRNA(Ile)-lysidine synthase
LFYYPSVQDRLLDHIRNRQLMRPGERVGVAVSGGADSVALLRLLLEIRASLGVVLAVVHFNHKLRGAESDADEQFVRELAEARGLEFFCASGDTRAHAEEHKCGIEAAARELRYAFFWRLLGAENKRSLDSGGQQQAASARDDRDQVLDRIATAHTMDDQAETVVLRLLRGAGTRGLSGILPVVWGNKRSFDSDATTRHPNAGRLVVGRFRAQDDRVNEGPAIVRPLLEFRRAQLRHYLKQKKQEWREDTSNADAAYARNKLRRELMPKLREFNPAIDQVLSETAEIARTEEAYWDDQVEKAAGRWSLVAGKDLLEFTVALQRRIVRAVAERRGVKLEFHHVQQILELFLSDPTRAEKRVELPDGYDAVVVERELRFERRCPKEQNLEYEFALSVPGEVEVPAAGLVIATRLSQSREGDLLDLDRIGSLRVRNWRPGDRYWPAHTREPKKIKELLQARQVPASARAHWPVVVGEEEEIVWVPGFAFPERLLLNRAGNEGLVLEHRVRA